MQMEFKDAYDFRVKRGDILIIAEQDSAIRGNAIFVRKGIILKPAESFDVDFARGEELSKEQINAELRIQKIQYRRFPRPRYTPGRLP